MLVRVFTFLFGFVMMVIGFSFLILYLNLLTIGYSFIEYVNFIIRRPEIYCLIVGMIVVILITIIPGGNKNELHL
ncbi:MAG: hypothetical protein E7166_05820 [Firmicutes bacterium]|nr:hypothetical protein [Bacillota bacterium]